MAVSDLVNLSGLMDDAKCFAFVRQRQSRALGTIYRPLITPSRPERSRPAD